MRKIIGLAAAGCLVGSALAVPADAHEWRGHYHYHHHGDGGFGDFVAGAVLVGGIAALVSSIHGNDRARQDAAVDRCAHEAEGRTGGQVADIVHVGSSKGYYTVDGTLDAGFDGPPVRDGRYDGPIHNSDYEGPPPGDGARLPPPLPRDGAGPPPPGPLSFRCVVHDGTIYSFRTTPGAA
ncbi:MAG TPA: hypothetical protein VH331_04720 [Allosphingosinicella sp.]|jgi:hypothetical protein|nr:hypothetical protein [Allosphingosinicella sp.]